MLAYIEIGKKEGTLIAGGHALETAENGYFLEPTVFANIAPDAVLAQEEIFGPVLALIKVENFEEGIEVANNTEYGLTGSLYTTDRERIDYRKPRVSRGQSLLQPQVHRSNGGSAPLWRLQHEWNGFKSRRPGLLDPLHPGQERGGKTVKIHAGDSFS